MEYFSLAWIHGEVSDEDFEAIPSAYRSKIAALAPRLPPEVRELATRISVHDGLIRRVLLDRRRASLALELRCGDLQAGYFDLDLMYEGVDSMEALAATLEPVAGDPRSEILCDEVDRPGDDVFAHRILFHSHREVEIRFRALRLARRPRPGRAIEPASVRYFDER